MSRVNISKKRKFVADGVFFAELNQVRYGTAFAHGVSWRLLWRHAATQGFGAGRDNRSISATDC